MISRIDVIIYIYIVRFISKKIIATFTPYHSEPDLGILMANNSYLSPEIPVKSKSMPELKTPLPPPSVKYPTNRKRFNKESATKIKYELTGRRNSFSPTIENQLNDIYGLDSIFCDEKKSSEQSSGHLTSSITSIDFHESEKVNLSRNIISPPKAKFSKTMVKTAKQCIVKLETIEENGDISP